MNLESPKVTVDKSAEYLFNALTDVKNFEKLMPDNIAKFEADSERHSRRRQFDIAAGDLLLLYYEN